MPRKIRLTPLQSNIIWLLEEAGEENIDTLVAMVKPPDREALARAVKGLVELGYVASLEETRDLGGSLLLTTRGRRALTT